METPEDEEEMEGLLKMHFVKKILDSQVRRHPRTYPINEEAVEHIELARDQLVETLEDAVPYE